MKLREVVERTIVENAHRLFYAVRGSEVYVELTREAALAILAALREHCDYTLDVAIVSEAEDKVVVKATLVVIESGRQTQTADLGEAWIPPQAGDKARQERERAYRTASTRAIKRAVEGQVGDLNRLLMALGQLFAVAKRPPRLTAAMLPALRRLAEGEISVDAFSKEVQQKPKSV